MVLIEPDINEFAQRQILAVAERALERAGVLGILPTPLDAVAQAAGIAEIIDIGALPPDLAAKKPAAWKRILGALLYRERVAFVDQSQALPRARFIQAHETGHRLIPWHEQSYILDNESGLFRETKEKLDREANLAAAHLLFQGQAFHARALDYAVTLATPIALAEEYGASVHATIRYYVEHHPDPIGLIVAGRYLDNGALPIWHCEESPAFIQHFGRLRAFFPAGHLVAGDDSAGLIAAIGQTALTQDTVVHGEAPITDVQGQRRLCTVEAYFNFYNLFVFVSPRQRFRLGRRVRIAPGAN